VVFAVSAFSKLRSRPAFHSFALWLGALPGLPALGGPVAAAIAAAEAAVVVLVALPWAWTAGLALAASVLAVFTVGTFLVVRAGVPAPCQCFGTPGAPLGWRHVVRAAVLCTAAAIGAAGAGPAPARAAGFALCLGVAALAAMFVFFLDDLAALFTGPRSSEDGAGPG
jgi:hypothetical protein